MKLFNSTLSRSTFIMSTDNHTENGSRSRTIVLIAGCTLGAGIIGASLFMMPRRPQTGDDTAWSESLKIAETAYRVNDLPKAEEYYGKAARSVKKSDGESSHNYINTLKFLSWVYEEQGKFAEARKVLVKMKGWSSTTSLQFKTTQLLAYAGTKPLEKEESEKTPGDWCKLQKKSREGIESLSRYLGENDPGLVPLYEELGRSSMALKDFQSAEDAFLKTASIREQSLGDSIAAAGNRIRLAELYVEWGNKVAGRKMNHDAWQLYSDAKKNYITAIGFYDRLNRANATEVASFRSDVDRCDALLKSLPDDTVGDTTVALQSGELPPFEP